MNKSRRHCMALTAFLCGLSCAGLALAQSPAPTEFPSKTIRLVIPFPAGGQTDVLARMLGQRLSERLGQPVIVESKPGANSMIAIEAVARSPGDGHTLLIAGTTFAINPLQYRKVPYDPFKDFVPVVRLGDNVAVYAISMQSPAKTLKEFLALAKSLSMTYGTPGAGSTTHMYGEILSQNAGVKLVHVPYKGDASMLPDLISDRVNSGFISGLAGAQFSKEGKLRMIAVTGKSRAPSLPDLPTFGEQGVPGMDAEGWVGLFAPAGTPKPVVDRLASEFDMALKDPVIREKATAIGLIPIGGTSDEFAANLRKTYDDWSRIVKNTNVRMD